MISPPSTGPLPQHADDLRFNIVVPVAAQPGI